MSSPKKRQGRRKKTSLAEMLEAELQERLGDHTRFVSTPKQQPKISEMLLELLFPYLEEAEDLAEIEMLFMLGMMAWNVTVQPPEEQAALLQKSVNIFPPKSQAEIQEFLEDLMQAKMALFPEHKLMILDFKVGIVKGELQVSVAASPLKRMP
jgi:AcrR family transcriptional regulator